ncbi:MAG: two-component system sensor histidine kinase NtrB [Candidatus Eiseniibacteriota bacterium]
MAFAVFLGALVVVLLQVSARLRDTLEERLGRSLQAAADLSAEAMRSEGTELEPGGGLWLRLEEIRRVTSVTDIWIYDRAGRLLGGSTEGTRAAAVPSRVLLGERPVDAPASEPRRPEHDAAGGLSLLVPLPQESGAGALLLRLDGEAQSGLAAVDFVFQVAKAVGLVAVAAGLLVLLRWVARGPVLPSAGSPPPSSDVDLVLGTMREVMTTLKDSETQYRDRVTAAEADAELWRQTSDLILESLPSGVVAFDSAGRITLFNRAAEEILAVPARTVRGRTLADALGGDDPVARLGHPAPRTELARTDAAGRARWLGISGSVLRRHDGAPIGGILVVSDLTETKTLREQMELKDRLSAVGEMSAGLAHEIKNSLHSLMGFANLLREDFPAEPPLPVRGILTEVETLEAMVKGILEFSRPSLLVKAPVSVNDLVRDVADSVAEAARRAGVDVRLETDEAVPPACIDAEAVRRAFLNLAKNAVEAMEKGGTLTIATRPSEGTPGEVRVAFRDTGPGIPEADRQRIFTPFWSTKRDGSGLGLALAHKTVTDHGGRLALLSRVGVGSEFVIHFPVEG